MLENQNLSSNVNSFEESSDFIVLKKNAARVLKLLKDGSPNAYEELTKFFTKRAFKIMKNKINIEDAKDVLQDTYIKIFNNLGNLKSDDAFYGWMKKILENQMIEFIRKDIRKNENIVNVEQDYLESIGSDNEIKIKNKRFDDKTDCINKKMDLFKLDMPERYEVIKMQLEGMSIEEIAEYRGSKPGATKEYISQSKKKFKPYAKECYEMDVT